MLQRHSVNVGAIEAGASASARAPMAALRPRSRLAQQRGPSTEQRRVSVRMHAAAEEVVKPNGTGKSAQQVC